MQAFGLSCYCPSALSQVPQTWWWHIMVHIICPHTLDMSLAPWEGRKLSLGELAPAKGCSYRASPMLSCCRMGGSWAACFLQLILLTSHIEG